MNTTRGSEDAGRELWSFSQAFYARPRVAAALIALQDEAGFDVNLVLFAIWFGLSGRGRLAVHKLDEARRAVHTIRIDVIEPLRMLRRRLKTIIDADIQQLRERVKAVEIEAEEAAQLRLAGIAEPPSTAAPLEQLADAEANLNLYLDASGVATRHAALIRCEVRRFVGSG